MAYLTAKERILSIRIIEKTEKDPKLAMELGIKAKMKNKKDQKNTKTKERRQNNERTI